jgi:hypothetical protein
MLLSANTHLMRGGVLAGQANVVTAFNRARDEA